MTDPNQDVHKGQRLKSLTSQSGWKDLLEMLKKEWDGAFYILRNGKTSEECKEANITMSVIEKLLKKIDKDIEFGKEQGEKMRMKALGKTSNVHPLS